jgi:hypothetical protein
MTKKKSRSFSEARSAIDGRYEKMSVARSKPRTTVVQSIPRKGFGVTGRPKKRPR